MTMSLAWSHQFWKAFKSCNLKSVPLLVVRSTRETYPSGPLIRCNHGTSPLSRAEETASELTGGNGSQARENQGALGSTSSEKDAVAAVSKPWYLQQCTPVQEQNPILDRQQMPELPPNPPALLNDFLQYISHDLGLDDLSVLDLRDIEPPPALGTNLIMVLGTARSEKHLHISAERFRRWLKTTHDKKASTDGLIGRGELKLKLRRKMRRAKLLSRVGATETNPIDDGIRTGWICVTIRDVQDGLIPEIRQDLQDDYVGFGLERSKCIVIVQMLTQEKRNELDLEHLWSNEQGPSSKESRNGESHSRAISGSSDDDRSSTFAFSKIPAVQSTLQRFPSPNLGQLRWHHSSGKRVHAQNCSNNDWSLICRPNLSLFSSTCWESPTFFGQRFRPIRKFHDARREMSSHVSNPSTMPITSERDSSALDLIKIKTMSITDARVLLSRDAPLWRNLEREEALFPSFEKYKEHLDLHIYAVQIGLTDHKSVVHELTKRIQSTFVSPNSPLCLDAITCLLHPPVSSSDIFGLTSILQSMFARRHDIPLEELRQDIEDTILICVAGRTSHTIAQSAYHHVRRLFNRISAFASVHDNVRSLYQCAHLDLWDEVWRIWREYPTAMHARPKELYCAILDCAASRKHQAKAIDCLRDCLAEMEIEEPPIELDAELAEIIKKCILVAEPNAPYEALDKTSNAEWARLWRRCDRVTDRSRLELD